MSATPRWRYIVDPDGKYGIYPEGGKFVAIVDSEESARLIIRAVNAHDALVAAVKRLLEGFEPMHKRLYEHSGFMNATQLGDRDWNRAVLSQAHAALKLAESQP